MDYFFEILACILIGLYAYQTYNYFFKSNNTEDIDLLGIYCNLKMRQRYKKSCPKSE